MEQYLSRYGWHFSKPMYEWAVSIMKDRNGSKVTPIEKKDAENTLAPYGVDMSKNGYDAVYVLSMAHADYYGSSITSEQQIGKFVADYLGDKDGYEEVAFTRFYADCIAKGIPMIWEDLM